MAHLLAMNVPVKRDPAWSDWAKMTRSKIKSAGVPVKRWQMFYYHMTILFLDDDTCVKTLTPEFAKTKIKDKGIIKKWKLLSK